MTRISQSQRGSLPVKGTMLVMLFLSFVLSFLGTSAKAEEDKTIELVFFNPDTTAKNPIDATNALQTFANVVGKKMNLPIRAYYFKRQNDLERFLQEKKVEYAILSQMFLVENYERLGLVPFAVPIRDGRKTYRIALVVRKDKGLNDLQDLKGTILAATALGDDNIPFYNKVVFRGEIDVTKHFKEIRTVDSVNSATLAILYGQADVAAVTVTSFAIAQELNPQVEKNLKSIYTSDETPISPMCFLKDNADPAILPALKEILLKTHLDPVGRQSCLAFNVEAWVETSMDDYRETERIVKEYELALAAKKPGSTPQKPVSAAAAIDAARTSATYLSPTVGAGAPAISRVQLFLNENNEVVCNAWVAGDSTSISNDKSSLLYTLRGGSQQQLAMTFAGEGRFTVNFPLPGREQKGEEKETIYTVKSGDTLGKIAEKLLGSSTRYMLIVSYNQLKDPNHITVGQKLNVKSGEVSLTEISYKVTAQNLQGVKVESPLKKVNL